MANRKLFGSATLFGNGKRARIHEYLSFRTAVKTDAGTAAAALTDESKVRFARYPTAMRDVSVSANTSMKLIAECVGRFVGFI
jgi:hypothetical protein